MSWIEEAQEKIKLKQNSPEDSNFSFPGKEDLIPELRSLYENATMREIEKAIEIAIEKKETFENKKELMDFFRIKLED